MLACLFTKFAPAQDATPPPLPVPREAVKPSREILPRVIYTLNEAGSWSPWVESFPWQAYDDFMQSLSVKKSTTVLTELAINGSIEEEQARIQSTVEIRILESGRHQVPIGMGNTHFLAQPTISSDHPEATVFAKYDETREEFELVVTGDAGQVIRVDFESNISIKKLGSRSFLRVALPRVPISSMELQLPETDLTIGCTQGMTIQRPTDRQIRIDGLLPNFELWWQADPQVDAPQESFDVQSDIDVTVDEMGNVRSQIALQATTFSNRIAGFTVRLPAGSRWEDASNSPSDDYTISNIGVDDTNRERLQVIFDQRTEKPPLVRIILANEKQSSNPEDATQVAVADFDVLGAASQSGLVRIVADGAWDLNFNLGNFARQTANRDSDELAKSFTYSRPGQISMLVTQQTSQLIVEPTYLVSLEETVVRLTAIYRCTRRGARKRDLTIEMGEWLFQSLGPDPNDVVDLPDLLTPSNQGQLIIPLDSSTDRFEVVMLAILPLEKGLQSTTSAKLEDSDEAPYTTINLSFPFPAEANRLLQSTIVLSNQENVAINVADTQQYSEIRVTDSLRSQFTETGPLMGFRMRAMGKPASLPVQAVQLARSTTVDIETQIVDVDPDRIRVRQRMEWKVDNVPLTQALLVMNKNIWNYGSLDIEIDGQSTTKNRSPYMGNAATDRVNVQVPIDKRRLGNFVMTVTYNWFNWDTEGSYSTWQGENPLDIDLVLPKKSSSARDAQLTIQHSFRKPRVQGYGITLDRGRNNSLSWPWQEEMVSSDIEASTSLYFDFLPLSIRQQAVTVRQPAQFDELVDRAWYQTWYTHSQRRDRAVFRVQGGEDTLRITVPQAALSSLTVWVDRQVVEHREADNETIEISIAPDQTAHVVELHYGSARGKVGLLKTSLPRIADAEILGQWYWHVVMPRNECMITWPRNLTRAHHWDWSKAVPRRKSEMSLANLERWSGAMPSGGKVLAGSSEYLFGAMGVPAGELTVRTASLPVYVLAMAGMVLVSGLLLVTTKRPGVVLLLLGITILGMITLNPSLASVTGQVAIFGLILFILGQLLRWLLHQPHQPTVMTSRSLSTWVQRSDVRTGDSHNSSVEPISTLMSGSSKMRNVP